MEKEKKDLEYISVPYKDDHLKYLIDPGDFLKFLEDAELKEELDICLNSIRSRETSDQNLCI